MPGPDLEPVPLEPAAERAERYCVDRHQPDPALTVPTCQVDGVPWPCVDWRQSRARLIAAGLTP
ncbi:MAG TPA: hypothetical protein VL652_34775 [Kutzneria sp.]|jgi:hypothetical protein|nr:hypothetical protein [Kutzneria sp.]